MTNWTKQFFLVLISGLFSSLALMAQTNPGQFQYEGQLLDNSGVPVTTPVLVKTKVLSPGAEACTLYEGSISVTPNSTGYFNLLVGSNSMSRLDSGVYNFKSIFINKNAFTGLSCLSGSSFTPTPGDGRKLQIAVSSDGGATWDDLGVLEINGTPVANTARNLNGFTEQNFCRIDDGSGNPVAFTPFTTAQDSVLRALISGTSNLYARSPANTGSLTEAEIPNLTSAGKVSGAAITSGVIGGSTSINTSGTIQSAGVITNSLGVRNGGNTVQLQSPPSANYALTLPTNVGAAGQTLTTDGTGVLSWQTVSGGGSGTVTNISTGSGLVGGPITTTGTISLATSGVTAGTYGTGILVPQIMVDSFGRITSATNVPFTPDWTSIVSKPTTLAGYAITDAIINAGGVPSLMSGTEGAKPGAAFPGRLYLATDTNKFYRDNGAAWTVFGDSNPWLITGADLSFTTGKVGIGVGNPTANLHLKPGGVAAGMAPLKFSTGSLMSNPEIGAIEFDGVNLFYTDNSMIRQTLSTTSTSTFSSVSNINNTVGNINLNSMAGGSVNVSSNAASVGANSGALVVTGGVGLGGSLNAGGTISASGSISTGSSILSPLIAGGTGPSQNITIDSTTSATKGNIFLAPTGGYVGIGTTSPLAKLHVESAISTIYTRGLQTSGWGGFDASNDVGQHLTMTLFGSTNGGMKYGLSTNGLAVIEANTANNLAIGTSTSSIPLVFGTNNMERMRIDPSTGYVGIGTTTPSATLEVSGVVKITGGAPGVGKVLTSDANGLGTWQPSNTLTGVTGSTHTTLGVNNNGTGTGHVAVGYQAGYNYTGSQSALFGYQAGGAGGTGSNNTIMGSMAANISALNGSNNTSIGAGSNPSTYSYTTLIGSNAMANGVGAVAIGSGATAPGNTVVIGSHNGTNFQERLRIDQIGNIGVGTTTPMDNLFIQSGAANGTGITLSTQGTNPSQQVRLTMMTNNNGSGTYGTGVSGKGWQLFANGNAYSGTPGPNDFGLTYFDGTTWFNPMIVKSTGEIGFGTNVPSAKIDMVGSSPSQPILQVSNTNSAGPALKVGSGTGIKNMGVCSVTIATLGVGTWSGDYPCSGIVNNNTVVVCSPPASGYNGTVTAKPSISAGNIQLNVSTVISTTTTFSCMWMN